LKGRGNIWIRIFNKLMENQKLINYD
jgi:hypothetical protein